MTASFVAKSTLPCWWLCTFACTAPSKPSEPPATPLEVEVSGCLSIRSGPICELPDTGAIRLRVRSAASAPRIEAGGRTLTGTVSELNGATLHAVTVPLDARELTVDRSWRIALSPAQKISAIEEAARAQKTGDAAAADRILTDALKIAEPRDRARLLRERARLARARGDPATLTFYREATDALIAEQRFCEAADYALAIAFNAMRIGRNFELARAALEEHRTLAARATACADPPARAPYYSGVLAMETGDLVNAVALFEDAEARTAKLALAADREYAVQGRALALEQLGRYEEAWRLLEARAQLDRSRSACDRALGFADRGWVALMLRESREAELARDDTPALADIRAAFESAHALYGTGEGKCDSAVSRANVEINLALVALAERKTDDAGRWIRSAKAALPKDDPPLQLWIGDVEGRVALAATRYAEAERIYVELTELAAELASDEAQWRAAIGRAAALEHLGKKDRATAAYRAAEAILDRESALLPLGRGRETFLSARDRGTQKFVDLLERSGQNAEALRVARAARARVLALVSKTGRLAQLSTADRAAWNEAIADYRRQRDQLDRLVAKRWMASKRSLPGWIEEHAATKTAVDAALRRALAVLSSGVANAEPRPVAKGELLLFYQSSAAGWIAFAANEGAVKSHRWKTVDAGAEPEALAAQLFAPFDAMIKAADRIRLMPEGALKAVDLHVLPWEGAPIFTRKLLAYAVDRPSTIAAAPDHRFERGPRSVLIVGDPANDLAAARREAAELALRFRDPPATLLDGAAASGTAVRGALSEHALFHFAGHAVFGGASGWESALLLANDDHLSIGDILALRRAPEHAILMACQSGQVSTRPGVETLGLAHAFLAAGTESVIAASRPLDDRAAAELSRGVHAHFAALRSSGEAPAGWELAEALRRTEAGARTANTRDFAALRAFIP